jgi:hypothetical protein
MSALSRHGWRWAVAWALFTYAPWAWAFQENADGLPRTDGSCWVFAKTRAVSRYSTIDPEDPRAAARLNPDSAADRGVYTSFPDYRLPPDECVKFNSTPPDRLFNISDRRGWYRRSDFLTHDQLTRVDRWTTRYVYRRTALSGAGAELGLNENMLSLGEEIEAYRASTIRRRLFIFTPDAHWVDMDRHVRWEMRLTPTGRLVLVDPTGTYQVQAGVVFHRSFPFSCSRDSDDKLVCGLQWHNASCDVLTDAANEYTRKICEPALRQRQEDRTGRIALFDDGDWYPGIKVQADKITISRRYSYSRKDLNQRILSFYARFDDPIRPVFFAPGVLFSDSAKPHPGKSRPGERVMKPVCLVDCPEQLAAQGLLP